jgi:MOSC domain-containing protein YiiM
MLPVVLAVSRSATHSFVKEPEFSIHLVAGHGVRGDAHFGKTVQHRSRVAKDPTRPNLRQVHLIHSELYDELNAAGFDVQSGDLGENITTRAIDLLGLPRGARLFIGDRVVVEITGLRNPCVQLDNFQKGLTAAVLGRDPEGNLIRKAGVMGIVLTGGDIRPGDFIKYRLPDGPHEALQVV